MPIKYKKTVALLDGICEIEDAEILLEWLQENRKGKLNLKNLEQPHAAVLQIILIFKRNITYWPDRNETRAYLNSSVLELE